MLVAFSALLAALAGTPPDSVPLYDNLGSFHRKVSASPIAQRYFDQGLRLYYAFNHPEAIRAFEEGARRDPGCAMCWWGVALALGPNINAPMDTASVAPAWAAVTKAKKASRNGTATERALIAALAKRYAADPATDRTKLDSAYASAARALVRTYPADDDVLALAAEAMMDLRPWNYWERDASPHSGTTELVGMLERVMARNPNHPGACHFYIHAVEAATPEKAVPCAERLAALMPGAGHLVHMPGHIYIRVGRYADAIKANEHAVHADESYISQERPPMGIYTGAYYPHNYHFMAFAAQLAGRSAKAIEAARIVTERVPLDMLAQVPFAQPIAVFHQLELQTFGRWDELLALPLPRSDLRFAAALAHFTRGMAFVATGKTDEARAALDTVETIAQALAKDDTQVSAEIGAQVLAAELDARAGRNDEALRKLEAARELEDAMIYIEPPYWHQPVRHFLGALLLTMKRPAEAEQRYREDLKRFPNNAWSLAGLAASLRAQGKDGEAADADARLAAVGPDLKLTGSRF